MTVNGTNVESQVTQDALKKNIATTFVYTEGPVFSLTVVYNLGKCYIIPSDVKYQDINEVAFLLNFVGLLDSCIVSNHFFKSVSLMN